MSLRHLVHVRLADGQLLTRVVPARQRSTTFAGVPAGVGATVTDLRLTRMNLKGPAAVARVV